jgi:hypothetical protein
MVKKKLYLYSNLISLVLGIVLCYVTYGPAGILIAIAAQIALGILLLIGFIPVVGVIIYAWLAWSSVIPWVAAVFGVEWAWSLTVMFALDLIVSIGCTLQAIIRIFTVYWRWPS